MFYNVFRKINIIKEKRNIENGYRNPSFTSERKERKVNIRFVFGVFGNRMGVFPYFSGDLRNLHGTFSGILQTREERKINLK